MRYLSPDSILDGPIAIPFDKRSLQLQKRRILTDLELSEDGFLHIKDRSLSKSDILEYFESLEKEITIPYHAEIAKDKVLLGFLEDAQLPDGAEFAPSTLYTDPPFIEWVSPYFYTSFTSYAANCFQNTNEAGLATLLQNPLLMTDLDRELAWVQIGQFIESRVAQLEHYYARAKQENNFTPVEEITALVDETLVRMVLMLPEGPFTGLRDAYAIIIFQNGIIFFNNLQKRRDTFMQWMESARLLAATEGLSKEISEKISEMHSLHNKSDSSLARAAAFIGIIVLKVLLGSGVCNSSHNDVPKASSFRYIDGKDTTDVRDIKQIDSLMHNRLYHDTSKIH